MVITRLKGDVIQWAPRIHAAIINEPELARRSCLQIAHHLKRGEVYVGMEENQLITFLFATSLGSGTTELHSFYTAPKYRRAGCFSQLLTSVVEGAQTNCLSVTFYPHVAALLQSSGFSRISFSSLPLKTRVKFATRRLNIQRLYEIIARASKSRPMFFLKPYVSA